MKLYTVIASEKNDLNPTWKICDSWGVPMCYSDERVAKAFQTVLQRSYPDEIFKIMEMKEVLLEGGAKAEELS